VLARLIQERPGAGTRKKSRGACHQRTAAAVVRAKTVRRFAPSRHPLSHRVVRSTFDQHENPPAQHVPEERRHPSNFSLPSSHFSLFISPRMTVPQWSD